MDNSETSDRAAYTAEQLEIIETAFATALYEWFMQNGLVGNIAARANEILKVFPWFLYRGNEFGILRYLELLGIKGAYEFPSFRHAKLYFRMAFNVEFTNKVFEKQPPLPIFLAAYKKARTMKPTPEMMAGKWSANLQRIRFQPSPVWPKHT